MPVHDGLVGDADDLDSSRAGTSRQVVPMTDGSDCKSRRGGLLGEALPAVISEDQEADGAKENDCPRNLQRTGRPGGIGLRRTEPMPFPMSKYRRTD